MRWRPLTLRRLHRWLGIGALVFLVALSVTGIVLNHTVALRLDERHVAWSWLLAWYGIETPAPRAAFMTELGDLVLVGEHLYLDEREIAVGVTDVVGATPWRDDLVVATTDALLFFDPDDGALTRQIAPPGDLELTRIGLTTDGSSAAGTATLVVASGTVQFHYDSERWVSHDTQPGADDVRWSLSVSLDSEAGERIARAYRGPGISLARLLADLHSGRLFGTAGTLATDVIGTVAILLGLTGLVLWLRGRR